MALPAGIEAEDPDDWGPCTSTAEWKLMYLNGVTIEQISRTCRVPSRRVRQNIQLFVKRNPELAGARLVLHDRPARPTAAELLRRPPRPSSDARLMQAKEFLHKHQRPPRILSKNPEEKALAVWIAGQRKQLRRHTLNSERLESMQTALGDWLGTPRVPRETQLWDQRLAEVADFINSKVAIRTTSPERED
ncbi:helicase associated domain-containing protein [Arthrobacter sp. Sr33]